MLLKYTAYTLAVLALFAEVSEARRRRKGGKRRGGKRRPAAAAPSEPEEYDEIFSSAMKEPGADELIASLVGDDFEDMTDFVNEFADEADDGFRGVGGGLDEAAFRGVTLQQIMNAGGPEFCRDMSKIRPQSRPKAGQPGWKQWSEMMDKCKELNGVMNKRKAACHNFLMKIVYNPNRKYELKPQEKTRHKYCFDITKLKSPWMWCEKTCKKGRKGRFCNTRKAQCKKRLAVWQENNKSLKDQKKGDKKCRPLPEGLKVPPPPNSPLYDKRKCKKVGKKWNCEYVENSDLPFCPYGYSEETKDQAFGKGAGQAWGVKPGAGGGKKPSKYKNKKRVPKGKGKGKGGFRELADPNSDEFQAMMSEMDQIDSQFGHSNLDKELNKFKNKNKRRNKYGRTSYEEAIALSYTDDDVRDRK